MRTRWWGWLSPRASVSARRKAPNPLMFAETEKRSRRQHVALAVMSWLYVSRHVPADSDDVENSGAAVGYLQKIVINAEDRVSDMSFRCRAHRQQPVRRANIYPQGLTASGAAREARPSH